MSFLGQATHTHFSLSKTILFFTIQVTYIFFSQRKLIHIHSLLHCHIYMDLYFPLPSISSFIMFLDLPCTNNLSQDRINGQDRPTALEEFMLTTSLSFVSVFDCHQYAYFSRILKKTISKNPLVTCKLLLPMQSSPRVKLRSNSNMLYRTHGGTFTFLCKLYTDHTLFMCSLGDSRHCRAGRNFENDL